MGKSGIGNKSGFSLIEQLNNWGNYYVGKKLKKASI